MFFYFTSFGCYYYFLTGVLDVIYNLHDKQILLYFSLGAKVLN